VNHLHPPVCYPTSESLRKLTGISIYQIQNEPLYAILQDCWRLKGSPGAKVGPRWQMGRACGISCLEPLVSRAKSHCCDCLCLPLAARAPASAPRAATGPAITATHQHEPKSAAICALPVCSTNQFSSPHRLREGGQWPLQGYLAADSSRPQKASAATAALPLLRVRAPASSKAAAKADGSA
jgi:hypothetical protein